MGKAKERNMKALLPLCRKLGNMKAVRNNKMKPSMSPNTKVNDVVVLSMDRRDDEYLQARRAVLRSYHLRSDGRSLKEKMKSFFKGVCSAIHTRFVRVYRFTIGCPCTERGNDGKMLVIRCFLPHLKSQKKPCMNCTL